LFIMLILGIIEFARVMMVGQLVTNATRAACRQATLSGSTTDSVTQSVTDALSAEGIKNSTVTVLVNDVAADASSAAAGDKMTVRVEVPLVDNAWLPTPLFIKGGSASATMVMRHE
jgi:Flp pilus assembly protein TadG